MDKLTVCLKIKQTGQNGKKNVWRSRYEYLKTTENAIGKVIHGGGSIMLRVCFIVSDTIVFHKVAETQKLRFFQLHLKPTTKWLKLG